MNPSKSGKVIHLSETEYQEYPVNQSMIQKAIEKKWWLLRKSFFFALGLVFYLIFSSL